MDEPTKRPIGLTKDTGFQIGVRRTLPIPLEAAWQLVTSPAGIQAWLGASPDLDFTKGARYQTDKGAHGEVRVFKPNSHLRITWQPGGWPRASTIQLRLIPKGERTVFSFHQEHLPGAAERAARRDHFRAALDRLESLIQASWG